MNCPLLRLLQHRRTLGLAQTSSDSSRLLWSEIEGQVLLVLVEETKLRALVCVDDCEDLGDGLADIVAAAEFSLASRINVSKVRDMKFIQDSVDVDTHILVSFDADPPAIFCVRS